MNNTNNNDITNELLASATTIIVMSGEGIQASSIEVYRGKRTARAVKSKLTRERCSGDRWSILTIDGHRV